MQKRTSKEPRELAEEWREAQQDTAQRDQSGHSPETEASQEADDNALSPVVVGIALGLAL